MSDWDVELTLTLGRGRVLTRAVTIEDVEQQAVAQVAGIEQCLAWANEPDSPIPLAALEHWQEAKRTGAMPYEVLTELESRWRITFTCKEHVEALAEPAPANPEAWLNGRASPPVPNGRASSPSLLGTLKQRYIELLEEQKRIGEELEILERLFGKPKRKYARRSKQS